MNELRILLVADDLLVRTGLASLLSNQSDLRIVGQSNGERIHDDVEVFQPDVVLWDLGWQETTLRRFISVGNLRVPMLALVGDPAWGATVLASLMNNKGYGLLPRDSHPDLIVMALTAIGRGLVVLVPVLAEVLNTPQMLTNDLPTEDLTNREQEVLQLLAQGLTNKAIALKLGITDHTVKFHVNAIMTKLNAQSRTDAVIRATRAGMVVL
jgi:DNA-binding NarL/FixJ family response regulator